MHTNNINVLLNVNLFELRAILGHLSEKDEFFRSQTIDCKKGSDWLTRWVETQQNIYDVKCFMIGQ